MRSVTRRFAPAVALLALVAGCGDEQDAQPAGESGTAAGEAAETAAPAAAGESGPRVSVSADKTHAVQPGDVLTVTVEVEGFTLAADKIGQASEPGVGHYHVYLDHAAGAEPLAVSADPAVQVSVPGDVTDGSHELRVVLHNNDHTPVEPAAEGSVWLIVYRL